MRKLGYVGLLNGAPVCGIVPELRNLSLYTHATPAIEVVPVYTDLKMGARRTELCEVFAAVLQGSPNVEAALHETLKHCGGTHEEVGEALKCLLLNFSGGGRT